MLIITYDEQHPHPRWNCRLVGSSMLLLTRGGLGCVRRLEIPEDMQKKHGFAPLGPANGRVKNQILGLNSASMYNINLRASYPRFTEDKFAKIKEEYRTAATLDSLRDNAAHGWIAKRSA